MFYEIYSASIFWVSHLTWYWNFCGILSLLHSSVPVNVLEISSSYMFQNTRKITSTEMLMRGRFLLWERGLPVVVFFDPVFWKYAIKDLVDRDILTRNAQHISSDTKEVTNVLETKMPIDYKDIGLTEGYMRKLIAERLYCNTQLRSPVLPPEYIQSVNRHAEKREKEVKAFVLKCCLHKRNSKELSNKIYSQIQNLSMQEIMLLFEENSCSPAAVGSVVSERDLPPQIEKSNLKEGVILRFADDKYYYIWVIVKMANDNSYQAALFNLSQACIVGFMTKIARDKYVVDGLMAYLA